MNKILRKYYPVTLPKKFANVSFTGGCAHDGYVPRSNSSQPHVFIANSVTHTVTQFMKKPIFTYKFYTKYVL